MKFSVITVVKNAHNVIEKTILSVINQHGVDVEYIIVDGASTDGTLDIINKYKDNISCCISEEDSGIYDAMNKGVSKAHGDIVCFMNAGDWYEDEVFQMVERVMKDSDIVYGRVNCITDGQRNGFVGISEYTDQETLRLYNLYCHQGLFIKKTLFDKYGFFDTNYKIYADYEWNLRVFSQGIKFNVIPQIVANFLDGGISTVRTWNSVNEMISIKKKYANDDYKDEINRMCHISKLEFKFEYMLNNLKKSLKNLIDKDGQYYVWGTGKYGGWCCEYMAINNIHPIGFIDSSMSHDEFEGFSVYHPDQIFSSSLIENKTIIIATIKYEDEIKEKIESCNTKVNIILFSNIMNDAVLPDNEFSKKYKR